MPVFHTKTIESILDPVAQQVSPYSFKNVNKLYTLHSEKSDGFEIPIGILMSVFHTKNIESILDPFKNYIVVFECDHFFLHHITSSFPVSFLFFLNIDFG